MLRSNHASTVQWRLTLVGLMLGLAGSLAAGAEPPRAPRTPLVRVVDLNIGETAEVKLADGRTVSVKLIDLKEQRDSIRSAVRRAEVTVQVDGQQARLVSATYHLPQALAGVRIDCPITKGYYTNANVDFWGLEKDARLRLWPAGSPLIEPDFFYYPVKQRWFATATQMANEPTYVDKFESPAVEKIYYHSGEDIGGTEGMVEVVAATDALVASVGLNVLDGHRRTVGHDSPVAERYDVVYLLDDQGWYYRYSHLLEIDKQIVPGRTIRKGDRIGLLGKEGASGGWSHLHFEIKSLQPSGKWGTQAAYGFLWEAYLRQYHPKLVAVARPHHLIWAGETIVLDGSRSWSDGDKISQYAWQLTDGSTAVGPQLERTYAQAGEFSEILKVTDSDGRVDYDFSIVQVLDRGRPKELPPSIHANYAPTFGIRPGDPVTFKVRTFGKAGKEAWDFGDGSPQVEVQSDGNVSPRAKDGYAVTVHRFAKPGHYVVTAVCSNAHGEKATAHLQVRVGPDE